MLFARNLVGHDQENWDVHDGWIEVLP
jgi:hypothetical protein